MGFSKAPAVEMQPPAVTYEDVQTDQGTVSRGRDRRRLANAMNSRSSILTQGGSGNGKTLLGQ